MPSFSALPLNSAHADGDAGHTAAHNDIAHWLSNAVFTVNGTGPNAAGDVSVTSGSTGATSWAPLSTLATWVSSRDYLAGPPAALVYGSDNLIYGAVLSTGPSNGGAVNPVGDATGSWAKLTFPTGSTGPQGATGAAGANGQGFNYRGLWAASTIYNPYDVVYSAGNGLLLATTSFTSGTTISLSNWTVIVPPAATILTTSGAPANTVGNNNDYAIDPNNGVLYGPKASGSWPAGIGLQGPAGNTNRYGTGAPSSAVGANGDSYLDTAAYILYAPKASGAWPAGVSLVGPAGSDTSGWAAADHGLKAWTFPTTHISSSTSMPSSSSSALIAVKVAVGFTLTKVCMQCATAGTGPQPTYMAVYQNGALVAQSADVSAQMTSTGTVTATVTGSVAAGVAQVFLWTTAAWTTYAQFSRAGGGASVVNLGTSPPHFGTASNPGSATAPSATPTPTAASSGYWAALG